MKKLTQAGLVLAAIFFAVPATNVFAQSAPPESPGTNDSVEVLRTVGRYLQRTYGPVVLFSPEIYCATRAACIEVESHAVPPAVAAQRTKLHAVLVESAGGRISSIEQAGACRPPGSQNCRLFGDAFFRVTEPIVAGDEATVRLHVNRNTGTPENSHIISEEILLTVAKAGGKWTVLSSRTISRA